MLSNTDIKDIKLAVLNNTFRRDFDKDPKFRERVLVFVEQRFSNWTKRGAGDSAHVNN